MRQRPRLAELGDVRAVHAEIVERTRRSAEEALELGGGGGGVSTDEPGRPRSSRPRSSRRRIAERLARTPVRDMLLQSMATFIDIAGIRLGLGPTGDEARDLAQARQAIEALRALLRWSSRSSAPAQARPFREPLAVLQMAYARAVEGPGASAAGAPPGGPPEGPPPPAAAAPRAIRPIRLWVPPGTRRPGDPRPRWASGTGPTSGPVW